MTIFCLWKVEEVVKERKAVDALMQEISKSSIIMNAVWTAYHTEENIPTDKVGDHRFHVVFMLARRDKINCLA